MMGSIGVKSNISGARFGEHLNQGIDRLHHQMHIDWRGDTVIAERLTHHRSHRQVRDIVVIHNIEMHHIRPSLEHGIYFIPQPGKVSRQNRRGDQIIRHVVGAPQCFESLVYWLAEPEGNRSLRSVSRSGVPTSSQMPW